MGFPLGSLLKQMKDWMLSKETRYPSILSSDIAAGTAGTAASREEASTAAETLLCAFFEEWEQHKPWPQLPPVRL